MTSHGSIFLERLEKIKCYKRDKSRYIISIISQYY